MTPMLNKLVAFVASSLLLITCVQAQDIKGNAAAGQTKNAMCIGCHGIAGYQSSFPEVHKVPMISGQSAQYIISALTAYKKGDRRHPTMRGIAGSLSEQDIADLAAYYSTHGVASGDHPPTAVKALNPKVGALLNKANCQSCHGANFSSPVDPNAPKIAGQYADYLFVALKSYKMDNNPTVGRSNPVMGAMSKQFTNAELKELATYLGSLPGELKVVPQSYLRR